MTIFSGTALKTGLAAALAMTLIAGPSHAQVEDYLGVPGPITFEGTEFSLVWTSNPEPHYIKQEYVPAGQAPEQYEQMVLLEAVSGPIGVLDAVSAQVEMLNQRRDTDPLVNMDLIHNEASEEALLDFIVSSRDAEGEYIVEWNAYRYAPLESSSKDPGVLLFGVSFRAYGNDGSRAFLEALPELRAARVNALANVELPRPDP